MIACFINATVWKCLRISFQRWLENVKIMRYGFGYMYVYKVFFDKAKAGKL